MQVELTTSNIVDDLDENSSESNEHPVPSHRSRSTASSRSLGRAVNSRPLQVANSTRKNSQKSSLQNTKEEGDNNNENEKWRLNGCNLRLICSFDFWNNVYLIQRFLLFLLCIILIILSTFYAFGQITKLSLENYFCENKSLEEIYQHSREFNLTKGTTNGCWHSKGIVVNEDALYSNDAYIISSDISFWNVFKCIVFIACSLWLCCCLVYYLFQFCNDFFVRYPKQYFHPMYVSCNFKIVFVCRCVLVSIDLFSLHVCNYDKLMLMSVKHTVAFAIA